MYCCVKFSALAHGIRHTTSISCHWQTLMRNTNIRSNIKQLRPCATTTVLRPFFQDHPGEPVPEENFWTLWSKGSLHAIYTVRRLFCPVYWTLWSKGRLTEADTPTIRLGATPSGLTSAHLHHPIFLQAGCPSCCPTNSVKALKATSAFELGRRR